MTVPLSTKAKSGSPAWFFALFGLFGLVFLYFFWIRPVSKIMEARSWNERPCVIVSSSVGRHSDSDGTTYSVDLVYNYSVEGRQFTGKRYHFFGGSSSGHKKKAAIVARHPAGAETVCYVNPRNPSEAVINRGFTPDLWFGLIPLAFVGLGFGGFFFSRRAARKAAEPMSLRGKAGTAFAMEIASEDSRTLKAAASPLGKLIVIILAALFWNGLVSVFVWHMLEGWRDHRPDWFLTIFLIPFELVGIGLIGAIGYQLLALFNPRPTIVITPGAVRLGDPFRLEWRMSGRAGAMERLRIYLEGREEATYRRGTNTATDKNVFKTIEITNLTSKLEFYSGEARVNIPRDSMHSFKSDNNKVVWAIHVRGDIPRWPDVKEEFPITVLPLKA